MRQGPTIIGRNIVLTFFPLLPSYLDCVSHGLVSTSIASARAAAASAAEPTKASPTGAATAAPEAGSTTGPSASTTASTRSPASPEATTTEPTASTDTGALGSARTLGGLGLGQEALKGKQLVGSDKDLVIHLEGRGHHALDHLDRKVLHRRRVRSPRDPLDRTTWLMGPRISSKRPICVLFSK